MNQDNPYQAPGTVVEKTRNGLDDIWGFVEPRSVSILRGLDWIAEGFRFFRETPGTWILITIVYFLLMVIASFIPFASNILQPIISGGLMSGLREQDSGGRLTINHLFEGFNQQGGRLALLGLLMLAFIIAVMVIVMITGLGSVFLGGATLSSTGSNQDPTFILVLLLIILPVTLIAMLLYGSLLWFGPSLIALHDLPLGEAFKMSLLALKRNILPIIVFSIIMLVLFALTIFTLYLGLLVVTPIFIGASYAAWKDIFTKASDA